MEIKLIEKFQRQTIEQLLSAIPFFKAVKQLDPAQFDTLLQYSRIITYRPGEVVLHRGDGDQCLYFLLKGRLAVYPSEALTGEPVNYVTPGEVFGDLARLMHSPRSATIVADTSSREIMVFSADFSAFGELESTHPISLPTKLLYYRNTVHNLRWKLEVYRSLHPKDELANRHRAVKLYLGPKDTLEELRSLHEQARTLASLLVAWNDRFGSIAPSSGQSPDRELLKALEH
ncbi:cyclic nucleotide-binding domain-containing protein [Gilvimarinus algae]|uniref:Cyclic nucleotide-binding domain-containing protein n=1 Tax=Gilvimarinus algae TaxID=3058037 RepID=A0ABT8TK84_9GAMM|nr:cyclic nucleotide-binding domain-containing protein [Gilvimarinus sp. SDUM040014]MDO3382782.1 cyclic nucleotide-binding domain-containing protein [Gilvimarinus sp. SDUM040014]